MKKILFVDDDPNVIETFKKLLFPMRNEWEMEFVFSAEDALGLMEKSSFDVVVSDLNMPDMDGAELLNIVMEKYPRTVRIIISGHPNKEEVLKSAKSAHQCLIKPCYAETIRYAVERTCNIQEVKK